jgi:hypothetical protein
MVDIVTVPNLDEAVAAIVRRLGIARLVRIEGFLRSTQDNARAAASRDHRGDARRNRQLCLSTGSAAALPRLRQAARTGCGN